MAVTGEVVLERSGSVMHEDSGPNVRSVIIESEVPFEGGGGAPVKVEFVCGMVLPVGLPTVVLLVVFGMVDVEGVTVALVLLGMVVLMIFDGKCGQGSDCCK